MATAKFYLIDNPSDESDGIIQTREKINVGLAWQNEGPNGGYISCGLDKAWLITEEDKVLLDEVKRKLRKQENE